MLAATVLMAALMLAMSIPAFAAKPFPEGYNRGNSPEHRANPSGKGNFGQCHRNDPSSGGKLIEGKESRTYNPSAQNTGVADCRLVAGRTDEGLGTWGARSWADCELEGVEAQAQGDLVFHPEVRPARDNFVACGPRG